MYSDNLDTFRSVERVVRCRVSETLKVYKFEIRPQIRFLLESFRVTIEPLFSNAFNKNTRSLNVNKVLSLRVSLFLLGVRPSFDTILDSRRITFTVG